MAESENFRRIFAGVSRHPLSDGQREPSDLSELSSACSETGTPEHEELLKNVEQCLDSYEPNSPEDNTYKILRAFLSELSTHGHNNAMKNIQTIGFANDAGLRDFAKYLVGTLLAPMRFAGIIAKTPIPDSPIPGVADAIALHMTTTEASDRGEQSTLKKQVLKRDEYRCVFTHRPDRLERSRRYHSA